MPPEQERMMTLHVGGKQAIEEALEGYEVKSPDVYHAVAARSATIVETLAEARRRITKIFGAEVRVRLSVDPDPEISGYAPVCAEILTPRGMEDGLERLERFDTEWWIDAAMNEPAEVIIMTMPQ